MKTFLFILYNFGSFKDYLTLDTRYRILAGLEIVKSQPIEKVVFVGGEGLEKYGGGPLVMKHFWEKQDSLFSGELVMLQKSNHSWGNICEIKNYLNSQPGQAVVVTSLFHQPRVKMSAKRAGLEARVVAAEEILKSKCLYEKEVKDYLNSFKYKKKRLLEKCITGCLALDPKLRIIQRIRKMVTYR